MKDPIERQAAIDAVKKNTFRLTFAEEQNCEGHVAWSANAVYSDVIEGTLLELPSAQPEQRWIPCSERLPDEKDAGILKKLGIEKRSEDVLATVEVKGERMTVTTCTYDGKWEWDMKYAFPDYKVIAWMPLPEPYGGDQNG